MAHNRRTHSEEFLVMIIFLFGDSFSTNNLGWPSMLGVKVRNFSENGIGEYKIFKKVMQNQKYDKGIICHTSPWRVHTPVHPIHKDNTDRPNNDFMFSDIEYYKQKNPEMELVHNYLKKYFDLNYQIDIYNLMLEKLFLAKNTIHITFHDPDDTKSIENNYNHIWKKYQGNINHMSLEGNQIVAEEIKKLI